MVINTTQHCAHLDQRLRWLGIRNAKGRKVYLFRCMGCGKTFSSHSPLSIEHDTRLLTNLSGSAQS